MARNRFGNGPQLSNMRLDRTTAGYLYVGAGAMVTLAMLYASRSLIAAHRDDVVEVLYLLVSCVLMGLVAVRIEHGRLALSGIGLGAAATLLNPLDATLVGLAIGVPMVRRGRWPMLGNSIMAGANACIGAFIAAHLQNGGALTLTERILVVLVVNLTSWIFTGLGLSIRTGEPLRRIVVRSFNADFYAAHAYFGLAALLTSYVINGSALGYLLATIVFVLSLALSDTIAGRRLRRVLESELSDADRHLFHSRAVEGVVHNLRNHMATAIGYLNEVDPRKLDLVDRQALETATSATNDAVTVLRTLSQGATPRVSYSTEPVELNDLVGRALGMARPRARTKEIELGLRESPEGVKVRADPLLLREVITNLVNNAIDAAPQHGHVELSTGRRSNGWPYFSVADNGPGVADENRHHLFEPHFTTKETGTGLGLFMSYGIVREHQGQLNYEGSRRGAVFTVTLPPFSR